MSTENSTLNTEAVEQGSAPAAVVEEPSQTTANDALATDDAAIFGNVRKQASESVEKRTPVTTEQDEPSDESDGEPKAVTTPQEVADKTETPEKPELTDEELEAMPEEIRGKARRERQWKRLFTKVAAAEQSAAAERKQREEIEKSVRDEIAKSSGNQLQPTVQPPPEVIQARQQAELAFNAISAAVQEGTKSEQDAAVAWNAVQTAYRKEGEWMAEQKLQAVFTQRQAAAQVERERTETLNTLADLSGDDPRFDMIDDIADVNRRANPQTPFGKMVHELCVKQYGRPIATWGELEGFALKASLLVQKGQAKLVANKVKIAENQTRSLANRIGLESSNRHAPPPRSVSTGNSDLRKRLGSDDPKVVKQARYELFESEAKSHGLA